MPNSPHVDFNVVNNNVEQTTPQQGVSHILGRTTKGKPFDPSIVITSLAQFQKIYGKEIVPDGSISNMEVALKMGSKLRVSRVLADDAEKGSFTVASTVTGGGLLVADTTGLFEAPIVFKVDSDKYIFLSLNTKEFGEVITGISAQEFGVAFELKVVAGVSSLYMRLYNTTKSDEMLTPVISLLVARYTATVFDTKVLKDFVENNTFLEVGLLAAKVGATLDLDDLPGINSMADIYLLLNDNWNGGAAYSPKDGEESTMAADDKYTVLGTLGTIGGVPSLANWKAAYDATKDYSDAYQLGASYPDQSLAANDLSSLHIYIGASAELLKEFVYYIDVPLYNVAGDVKSGEDIINWVDSSIAEVGNSAYVAYFGGGYKFNNSQGFVTDAYNLGTVLALGDVSASTVGPWYHFSGHNRGLVLNSKGTVSPNYGSPSNYDKLNALANARVNMSVIKDTNSYGKQVMLVHNFTSSLKTDSFRFLGVVRLILYMKKQFRPILEGALEEPNLPVTWRGIHRKIMAIVDDIKGRNGLTDPFYTGDQDATSLSGLQYNNEADVRMGKYKAKLTFKDVIALQEITFELEIDTVNNQVTIN